MFEEKLDTADFCPIFECIEDREGEVRICETREREVTAFKVKKTQELPGELMQTGAEGGGSWEMHTQAKQDSVVI